MRKRTWKTTLTSVLFAGMVGAVALGGACLAQAAAEETAGFKMTGAEARVVEPYGLRFTAQIGQKDFAKVDKEGEFFGMLIVPELYLTHFQTQLEVGGNDYVTVLEQQNVFVANVHPIIPYADGDYYRMNGVLGEVAYDNLNEPFVGIAYMYNEGGYEYAEFTDESGTILKTSFGDIVGRATASDMVGVAEPAKALAYQLNYLSVAASLGVEESAAKAAANALFGQDWKTSLASGLTDNQVANFDDERYLQLLSNTDTSVFKGWTSDFANEELKIEQVDDRTALELHATNYRALKIQFVKPAIVTKNTVVRITMKNPSSYNVQVQKGGIAGACASGWNTVAYLATDLGFEVGELMSSISLRLHNATEWYYIDEITVSERADLVSSLSVSSAGYGEVSNFNSPDYATVLEGKNAYGAIVADGKFAVYVPYSENFVDKTYIPFAREITVRDGDKLTFTLKGTGLRIDKKDGTNHINNNYWGETITVRLVKDLGYSVGDKVSCLTLSGNNFVAYVGTIKLVNDNANQIELQEKLTGYQVANFDDAKYQNFVSSGTVENGVLTYTGSWNNGVTISFLEEKTVSANDYLVIKMKSENSVAVKKMTESGLSGNFYLLDESNGVNDYYTDYRKTYRWLTSSNYQVVLIPIVGIGYTVEQTMNSINIANWKDNASLTVDWVEYVTLSSGELEKNVALKEYYELKQAYLATTVYPNATSASVDFGDEKATSLLVYNSGVSNGSDIEYLYSDWEKANYSFDNDNKAVTFAGNSWTNSKVRIYFAKPITVTKKTKIKINILANPCDNTALRFAAFDNSYLYSSLTSKTGEWTTITLETNGTDESHNLFNSSMYGKTLSYLEIRFYGKATNLSIKSITVTE